MTHTTDPTAVLGVFFVLLLGAAAHLIRRFDSVRAPAVATDSAFDRVQRGVHWSIAASAAGLFVTGLPIYLSQFIVTPATPFRFGFTYWGLVVSAWLQVHIILAFTLTLLVVFHAFWDVHRIRGAPSMKLTGPDLAEAKIRTLSFFGLSNARSASGAKYDPFQKVFHWTLLALGFFLFISGLVTWDAVQWQGVPLFVLFDRINHAVVDGFIRTGHLVVAMVVGGLSVLHVYFALLPSNRGFLRTIIRGSSHWTTRMHDGRDDGT